MRTVIKNARLSFPNLFTAEEFEKGDGKARYGCALLIPKDDPQVATIEEANEVAGVEKFGTKWADPKFRNTVKMHAWRDGDDKDYEGYDDCMYISANRSEKKGPPTTVGRDRQTLTESDGVLYGGCYVNALVDFYGDDRYGKTINCSLQGVQFVRDGDAFSGGGRAKAEDFEDLTDDEDFEALMQ